MEQRVFGRSLPSGTGGRSGDRAYGKLLRTSLEEIAKELERDLEQGARDNDYLKDENADALKSAAKNLERCGVRCYSLERKIDALAWFVGGDPDKILKLQKALNELGVGERLKEDGTFGEKTRKALSTSVQEVIDHIGEFLADPKRAHALEEVITFAYESADGPLDSGIDIYGITKRARQEIQRTIWRLGAEYYLRPRGYDVAALLLEHSVEKSPSNLHFSQSHWVTQKIMQSNGFRQFYRNLENQIQQHLSENTMAGSELIKFGNSDTDLYLGFGDCTVYYTCRRNLSSVQIDFTVYDRYDFGGLRSVSGDIERVVKFNFKIGNLANDAGLFSQADGAISKYEIYAKFQKTILIRGVNL